MKLNLKNIGKIKEAGIELNGITVIAGENNTGKSTVGKALFAIYSSCYEMEMQVEFARKQSIMDVLRRLSFDPRPVIRRRSWMNPITSTITYEFEHSDIKADEITNIIKNKCRDLDLKLDMSEQELRNVSEKIQRVLEIPNNEIKKSIIRRMLEVEFSGQIVNAYQNPEGNIQLTNNSDAISIFIWADGDINVSNLDDIVFYSQAIYIDDPFVLDDYESVMYSLESSLPQYVNHRYHLCNLLYGRKKETSLTDEVVVRDRMKTLIAKLSVPCKGDITQDNDMYYYKVVDSEVRLAIGNLSTGIKTFAILKTLLQKGVLAENSVLILDEPEIHLHPEWQLLFAELVVLLQKEFNLKVLLNTHSPYFLRAIEVYSAKYENDMFCRYYLATSDEKYSTITDVTKNTEAIYSLLAKPFQTLETESSDLC